MAGSSSAVDVAIIGAGAAGLAAAKTLMDAGQNPLVLEASHRIGGRAYTEEIAPGVHFDLGCHWLHAASVNPFRRIADELGFAYTKEGFDSRLVLDGVWQDEATTKAASRFIDENMATMDAYDGSRGDISIYDVVERDSRWTPLLDYYISLWTSFDPDEVSALDCGRFTDTGENWPLVQGYGNLVARYGAGVPVQLNSAVTEIDWSGPGVKLTTPQGVVTADKVVITVSTGVLGAGDIRFTPELPLAKQEAIAGLPLGNHNQICLILEEGALAPDLPARVAVVDGEDVPLSLRLRPFERNLVIGVTGGRHADWLERAGQAASIDLVTEKIKQVLGTAIGDKVVGHCVTAWRGDPWVKGAYSSARPGEEGQREVLVEPLAERLYFAGEATSRHAFSSCHGAYESGLAVAGTLLAAQGLAVA